MYLRHYRTLPTKVLIAKAKKVVDDKCWTHTHTYQKLTHAYTINVLRCENPLTHYQQTVQVLEPLFLVITDSLIKQSPIVTTAGYD